MGRKSRLKKERNYLKNKGDVNKDNVWEGREPQKLNKESPPIFPSPIKDSESVYRFFKEEWQAESLCGGRVWISTLEACRAYEDPLQGDSGEATHTYNSGYAAGDSTDLNLLEIAARSGVRIGKNCSNIVVDGNISIQLLRDAFVLCTTREYNPQMLNDTFGMYCVEISNPNVFFEEVTKELNKITSLRSSHMGEVIYSSREYSGLDNPPGKIGFVKPADLYSSQKEFRFLWEPQGNEPIKPTLVSCPTITELCKRIS